MNNSYLFNDAMLNNLDRNEFERYAADEQSLRIMQTIDDRLAEETVLMERVQEIKKQLNDLLPEQDLSTIERFLEDLKNA